MKATGTGILLVAVALAALALGGCGGGSEEEGNATAAGGSASGKEAAAAQRSAEEEEEAKAGSGAGEGNPSATGTLKQGPGITPPKGPREKGITPAEEKNATEADISLTSPAMGQTGESVQILPAKYTCDGEDTWPELKWSGIPEGSEELILFVLNLQPVGQELFFNWAVAGIDPSSEGIEEGKLPSGVTLGQNGFGKEGYSICPLEAETIVFALYALPSALSPAKGFDPMTLRKAVLEASGNVGLLVASYGRG